LCAGWLIGGAGRAIVLPICEKQGADQATPPQDDPNLPQGGANLLQDVSNLLQDDKKLLQLL